MEARKRKKSDPSPFPDRPNQIGLFVLLGVLVLGFLASVLLLEGSGFIMGRHHVFVVGLVIALFFLTTAWVILKPRSPTSSEPAEESDLGTALAQTHCSRFFDLSLDMLCIADVDGYFKWINPAFDALGYSRDELLSKPFLEFVHLDDRAKTQAEIQKLSKGIPTIQFENRYRRKDGQYRWIAWTTFPDESGALYAVARDVTATKELAERARKNEARLQRIVSGVNDGIFEWNPVTGDAYHSERWNQLLGYEDGELSNRGDAYFENIHPDDRARILSAVDGHFKKNLPYDVEVRLRCKNGSYKWFRSRGDATRTPDGKPVLLSGSITDIDEKKRIESELSERNRALQEAIRARDEMVGVVSHEIKNPLFALQAGIVLIKRLLPQEPRLENIAKTLQRLNPSIERMNQLISDLLDVTRIEAKAFKINPRACDLETIVQEIVHSYEAVAQEKLVQISHQIPPDCRDILADPDRLKQVLANLINNAFKFTNTGGSINILARRVQQKVEVCVRDTGKGISAEQLPHVFDRFWQAKDTAYLGTGLGLAIVKGLVESHGGKIWVESSPGVGSAFYFTVPIAKTQSAPLIQRAS